MFFEIGKKNTILNANPSLETRDSELATPAREAAGQWRLIGMRFRRHRLAVWFLYILTALYVLAAVAEIVSPYSKSRRNVQYSYAPPQIPRFSFGDGFYVYDQVQKTDEVTLARYYEVNREVRIPLGFLVKGEPYRIWGIFGAQRRLFGVKQESFGRKYPERETPDFHFFGADQFGRDILSRIIFGSRISLSIGLLSIFFTFVLGVSIGGVSGYFGGKVDILIQRLIEVLNSFPHLPLWLALGAILPAEWSSLKVYFCITLIVSLLNWTGLARIVRGKILSLREEDYAIAARLLGANDVRILFRHLIPGFTSHIIVALTLSVPVMILAETSLSFLGLGLRPPVVSWGVMLQDCLDLQVVANYPWLLIPIYFVVVAVLAFNFVGDGLRDASDPYSAR